MLRLCGRGRGRECARSSGLGRRSQACEQVRSGGARRRSTVILWIGRLGGFEGEALDVRSVGPSGSKARAGHAQTIAGREVAVRHLSKTACVHTQGLMLYRWKDS